ncbi:MAG: hypothetical protein LBR36_05820 [Bacteroidales bacterium]|jgi:hypothetical protein|nr:hypothetical protein [Bacteroidales bacterium]
MFLFQNGIKKHQKRQFNYKGRVRYSESGNNDIRRQKIMDGEENPSVDFSSRFRHRVAQSRKAKQTPLLKIAVMVALLVLLLYFLLR